MRCTALLIGLLLGTMACSSSRDRVPPPAGLPTTFARSGEAALGDSWWEHFQDPVLEGLVARALGSNFNLRIAWDRLAQAEAEARQVNAALWPGVDTELGGWRRAQRQTVTGPGGETTDTTYTTRLSLGLVASYEVDLWGRIRSARDAAALDVQATREQLQAAAITLIAQLAETWYALVAQHGQVDLLRRQLRTNEEVLGLVTQRFRRGTVGAADVLRQRQLVESTRGNLATAESLAAVRAHQLAVLAGQPPTATIAPRQTALAVLPPLPATGVPTDLLQRRPDLRQAQASVLAADRRLASAIANQFPRIGLTASAETSAEDVRDLFNNWLATLAANLVAPVFDAGTRRAEVRRNRAVVSERLNTYHQTVLVSLAEVEDALVQEQKQRDFLTSLEKQLELSHRIIERIRDSYVKGAVDYLNVLEALLTQQTLQRTHLQARQQLIAYRLDLYRALAGGWELARPPLATVRSADGNDTPAPPTLP